MDNTLKFAAIAQEMVETYRKKNADYGNSFDQSLDKHGLIAAVVRMEDKMNRIENLTKQEAQVKEESLIDTLTDLANYAIMTRMYLEEHKKNS